MSLVDRLNRVRARVAAACEAAGRSVDEVTLIAVSKRQSPAGILAAIQAGQVDFGESYAQELRDHARLHPDPRWHFIGRIQRNKAKYVSPVVHRVHTLETIPQAEALVARASHPLKCLVPVNLANEAQKSGVAPEQTLQRCHELARVSGIEVVGLMCLPPFSEDPEQTAPYFEQLAHLARQGRAEGLPLTELSMGMSHDFEQAIRYGATWVRVGTAIFGPREDVRS